MNGRSGSCWARSLDPSSLLLVDFYDLMRYLDYCCLGGIIQVILYCLDHHHLRHQSHLRHHIHQIHPFPTILPNHCTHKFKSNDPNFLIVRLYMGSSIFLAAFALHNSHSLHSPKSSLY